MKNEDIPFGEDRFLVDPTTIETREIVWLVPQLVPAHTLVNLQGHGGVGKGPYTIGLGASLTRCETPLGRGFAAYAATEDDWGAVLLPRLIAADADLKYVRLVKPLNLPADVPDLERELLGWKASLTVNTGLLSIDPVLGQMGDHVKSHQDHAVKRALHPLVDMARRVPVTVMTVLHFTKSTDRGASYSGQASGAFRNTARAVLAMVLHDEEDDTRLLEVVKSNYGPTGVGQRYLVELTDVPGLETKHVVLVPDGNADKTVDTALAAMRHKQNGDKVPDEDIQALVLRELEAGGRALNDLQAIATEELGAARTATYERVSNRSTSAVPSTASSTE